MPTDTNTISKEYQDQLLELRKVHPEWGGGGLIHVEDLIQLVINYKIKSVLDYGCGRGNVVALMRQMLPMVRVEGYDPGVEQFMKLPEPAELVVSTDVLEHIEPSLIDNTVGELRRLTTRIGYHSIHTGPARVTLLDGRNAHLIQEGPGWWVDKFVAHDFRQLWMVRLKEHVNLMCMLEGQKNG